MRPWIAKISDVVGSRECEAGLADGRYVRAVPEPFYNGGFARAVAAWEVFRGRAYAFRWPSSEELDRALSR